MTPKYSKHIGMFNFIGSSKLILAINSFSALLLSVTHTGIFVELTLCENKVGGHCISV